MEDGSASDYLVSHHLTNLDLVDLLAGQEALSGNRVDDFFISHIVAEAALGMQ